ncbi:GNAT family N-acetyltransferase [Paenibacillus cremeus]|uniref:GNAT family N-acetyltransferase n=1 Tax=Paenibacillus cremeus TaxID=2163881 RepID=A0A559K6W9_9BACL|nr:GNAT family protein [Paenibacillus cremeus]TVY07864.1 GNAT family N-acetyltransferase [Paenibacillus cremeus]
MVDKRISLRAFERDDVRELHRWMNDPESLRLVGRAPVTYEEALRHYEKKKQSGDLVLAIVGEGKPLVGWIFLKDIEHEHGRAGIGILLAPESRGSGYGRLAMEQMIDLGFRQLRLHKIYLTTRSINERAIQLYTRLGFVTEGRLRQHAYVDGAYSDTLFMGLLSEEWHHKD